LQRKVWTLASEDTLPCTEWTKSLPHWTADVLLWTAISEIGRRVADRASLSL